MFAIGVSYFVSAILVAFVLVAALLIGYALPRGRNHAGTARRARLFFALAGTILIAVAGLEKVGWSVHPWAPGSPAEAWNDLLFRVIALIGLGLLLIAWTLAFIQAGRTDEAAGRLESRRELRPFPEQISKN